jgi:pimeloyl-ACP methyl ester carboxylesterase
VYGREVVLRFDGFELDTGRRELRCRGELRPLQPQAFAVLEYLVRHRDRAVSKAELLRELWPDTVVGEGSVQRAVSLARTAIGDDGTRLRTLPRHGYRFVASVEGGAAEELPRPRFARSGDVHIAYCTLGEGELDIVIVPGWVFPMQAFFDHPVIAAPIRALTRFGRVILFDKRGTGLSDRVKELPTLEQRMDDLRAVLDAAGSREALLVGYSEGGPLCLLYATSYPERTRGLLLIGAFARWTAAPDYPAGWSAEVIAGLRRYIGQAWGAGDTIRAIVQSHAGDADIAAWAARTETQGASPGAALELLEMNSQVDVRPLLGAVAVPTLILHHTGDAVIPVANARYLGAHIPGARLVEVDGDDHMFAFEDVDRLLDGITWLVEQERDATERFLTTVLVVEGADPEGPDAAALAEVVAAHRGVRDAAGPVWSFDGPQRAIRCGQAMLERWRGAAAAARLGVHTGEVARGPGGLSGDGLVVATALARAADPKEVWVSAVVRDLVYGSGLRFEVRTPVAVGEGRAVRALAVAPV